MRHLTQQAVVLQKRINELKGKNTTLPSLQISPPSINSVLQTLNLINGIVHVFNISPSNLNNLLKENSLDAEPKKIIEEALD